MSQYIDPDCYEGAAMPMNWVAKPNEKDRDASEVITKKEINLTALDN
jgi:hypothetical protein